MDLLPFGIVLVLLACVLARGRGALSGQRALDLDRELRAYEARRHGTNDPALEGSR